MKYLKILAPSLCAAAVLLSGCHTTVDTETVGGTLVGLTSNNSVVLQNNGADNLTLTANGNFVFHTALNTGSTYTVSILTQPTGELCAVENSVGLVNANIGNVSSVVINCVSSVSSSDDVYGTVTGLAAGNILKLTNNGVDTVTITSTGPAAQNFAFGQALPIGTPYQVAISAQPNGQNCSITGGSTGTISATVALAPVTVTCI